MGNKANKERVQSGAAGQDERGNEPRKDFVIRYASDIEPGNVVLLTPSNLMRVLQYVWGPEEKIETKWPTIGLMLRINTSKLNEITRHCRSYRESIEKVLEFWLTWFPYASWRWWGEWFESKLYVDKAKEMRKYAEPISDPTLTVGNVLSLLCHAGTPMLNSLQFPAPPTYYNLPRSPSRQEHEYIELWSKWWLSSSPRANWEYLAERFYYFEDVNIPFVKEYLKRTPEPTLTVDNLMSVLAPIKDWDLLLALLTGVPPSKQEKLVPPGVGANQKREILIREFLENNPARSWKRVLYAVYEMAFQENCYGILEVIHHKYLNEFSLQNLCIFAVRKNLKNSVDDVQSLPLPEQIKSRILQLSN